MDGSLYRIQFSVLIIHNDRNYLVYIGFRIYRINSAVRRDPIYPSSTAFHYILLVEHIYVDLSSTA